MRWRAQPRRAERARFFLGALGLALALGSCADPSREASSIASREPALDEPGELLRPPSGVRHDGADDRVLRRVREPRSSGDFAWSSSVGDNRVACGKASDCAAGRRRNEWVFERHPIAMNEERWIAFDVLLDDDWTWDRRHSTSVAQIKLEDDRGGSDPLAMVEWKAFGRRGLTTFFTEPVAWEQWRPEPGVWRRVTIGMKLSADPARGFFELWVDDRLLSRHWGATVPPSARGGGARLWAELRLGVYKSHLERDDGRSERLRAFYDGLRFASSREGLEAADDLIE